MWKKYVFFSAARFWKFVSPFYSDCTRSRFPWCDVEPIFLVFFPRNLCLSLEFSGGVKLSFFLTSSFFVCFFGPALYFSDEAQLRPCVFSTFVRTKCWCTSHLFLYAKNAKNTDFRKYWPCSTRITRICRVFFHVRAAKSWPGYSDCIIVKSHHGSPPQAGGSQVPPPWLAGAGHLDLAGGDLRKLSELCKLSAPSALSDLS